MSLLVILLVVLLLCGVGWGGYGYSRRGAWSPVDWSPLVVLIVVLILLYVLGVVHL